MIITVYEDLTTARSVDLDRTTVDLRNMFTSIHRFSNTSISGTIVEDVTTFTSQGEFSPEMLVDGLIEKYGAGDVYDTCKPGEQARRISVVRIDESNRSNLGIPRSIYSGSEMVYVIKPDRERLSSELEAKIQRANRK